MQNYKNGFQYGMTMTDEPGFYDETRGFGIRIENTMNILLEVSEKIPS